MACEPLSNLGYGVVDHSSHADGKVIGTTEVKKSGVMSIGAEV